MRTKQIFSVAAIVVSGFFSSEQLDGQSVTAVQNGETLVLSGSRNSDEITLTFPNEQDVVVTGVGSTTVNSEQNNEEVEFTNVSAIFVILGRGDDSVEVTSGMYAGRLHIETGDGDDMIKLGSEPDSIELFEGSMEPTLRIGQALVILSGRDDDSIDLTNVSVGGRLEINAGTGDDVLQIVGTLQNYFAERVLLIAGVGNDQFLIEAAEIVGSCRIEGNSGKFLAEIRETLFEESVTIVGSRQTDQILIADSSFNSTLTVDGNNGDDRIELMGLEGATVIARGGSGKDVIKVLDNNVSNIDVIGNSGNDVFDLDGNQADNARIYGDSGKDILNEGTNDFGNLIVESVEIRN